MTPSKRLVRNFLTTKKHNYGLVMTLFALFSCIVMSNIYWQYPNGIGSLLAASPETVFGFQEFWRLFSSSFIHGDLNHLLSNSVMLTLMGYFVSSQYGAIIYPVISFILGAVINVVVLLTFKDDTTIVGASGVVYLLWGFWLILYILIQKHVSLNRRFMKVTAVGIFILVPTSYQPNVSYLAHAVGFFIGVTSGLTYYLIFKTFILSHEVWEEIIEEEDYDDIETRGSTEDTTSGYLH